jgi:P27 family predicted phage terminase small subunit
LSPDDEIKPPKGLTTRSRKLWRAVIDEYELSSAELELLRTALVALDEEDAAAAIIKRDGPVVLDRYGTPKAHPAVDVRNRARAYFARVVAQLGIKMHTELQGRLGAKPGPKPRLGVVKRRI